MAGTTTFSSTYAFQAERDRWDPVALSRGQLPSVKDEVTVIPWNDLNVVQQTLERDLDIAVLILEPVMCNTSLHHA